MNNVLYVGKMIWNKQNYRKNPATERRTHSPMTRNWVFHDRPDLRIVSDELWAKVKKLQVETRED
ncbi:hypothetical protein ASD31_24710 [Rhizobium sp. Root482]|nr:hypothetical protein ASD31_24710 [Rhizobium sp. Root482]